MPRKSPVILKKDIEGEIRKAWKFQPYRITFQGPSIDRYQDRLEYECLNCNHKMTKTFAELEDLWKKGYYCPECYGSVDPVYKETLPEELIETNEKFIPDLDAEYTIMSGIEEHLGYQPYAFVSINARKSVRLQHKMCNTIFTATPSMIYAMTKVIDPYNGETLSVPYCPKCNQIMSEEGKNYGAIRFIERLDNHFTHGNADFPYEFNEDDIFRFKDLNEKCVISCKYCGNKFTEYPGNLFTNDFKSLCPVCHGTPVKTDSGERSIQEVENEIAKQKVEESQKQSQQLEEKRKQDEIDSENAQPKDVIQVSTVEKVEETSAQCKTEEQVVDEIDKPNFSKKNCSYKCPLIDSCDETLCQVTAKIQQFILLEEENSELKMHEKSSKSEIEIRDKKISQLENQIATKDKLLQEEETSLRDYVEKVEKLEDSLKKQEEEIEKYDQSLEDVNSKLTKSENRCKNLGEKIKYLNDEILSKDDQISKLEKQIEELTEKLETLNRRKIQSSEFTTDDVESEVSRIDISEEDSIDVSNVLDGIGFSTSAKRDSTFSELMTISNNHKIGLFEKFNCSVKLIQNRLKDGSIVSGDESEITKRLGKVYSVMVGITPDSETEDAEDTSQIDKTDERASVKLEDIDVESVMNAKDQEDEDEDNTSSYFFDEAEETCAIGEAHSNSSVQPIPSSDEIVAVEADVESMAEEAEMYETDSFESEKFDSSNVDPAGYPEIYEPKKTEPFQPDFMNPEMVHNEENDALVADPVPTEETEEEIAQSMGEIFEDLGIEKDVGQSAEDDIIVTESDNSEEESLYDEDGIPCEEPEDYFGSEDEPNTIPCESSVPPINVDPFEAPRFSSVLSQSMFSSDQLDSMFGQTSQSQTETEIDIINQNQQKPSVNGFDNFEFVDDDLM